MKPVDQTTFGVGPGPGSGNCRAAAMASIFEVPLEAVPNFDAEVEEGWNVRLWEWWLERGILLEELGHGDPLDDAYGYTVANGTDQNGHAHSVVYRGGKLAHDPNERNGRRGLAEVASQWVLVLADVGKLERWKRDIAEALYFTAAAGVGEGSGSGQAVGLG